MWIGISIVVLGLFFMLFFQKNIKGILDRTQKVKYGSGEIQTENPSQEPVDSTVSSTEEHTREFDSPVLREQVDLINNELTSMQASEKERFLVRYLSIVKLELAFERIYSIIWGSQIYILEHLNDRRFIGASKEDIKTSFYDPAVTRWPTFFRNYSYEAYLAFLKSSNLVREEGPLLFVTDFGVDFLQYLTRTGKSSARFKLG
ncbi:MAG: hypothetical protein ABSG99_09605 [Sedimentisphaerales bacterium]